MALPSNSRVQHNRKLVIAGSSITTAKLRGMKSLKAGTKVQDEIEAEIVSSGYLEGAPFDFVGVVIRYGFKFDQEVKFLGLDKKTLCYEGAIEVDVQEMLESDFDELVLLFRKAVLIALIAIGKKFDLQTVHLEHLLGQLVE
ncbi:Imm39 family immunity protein [uncultured Erythrobacter sp.]|uniref:Imm39 family immunity protein n=1 Tax=uncultured Erythrobacter sp. TaxID=263913 RepID=UPI00261C5CCD|nr:Imm39 family immunity protein [uncultured Erythrobacter sp.]